MSDQTPRVPDNLYWHPTRGVLERAGNDIWRHLSGGGWMPRHMWPADAVKLVIDRPAAAPAKSFAVQLSEASIAAFRAKIYPAAAPAEPREWSLVTVIPLIDGGFVATYESPFDEMRIRFPRGVAIPERLPVSKGDH